MKSTDDPKPGGVSILTYDRLKAYILVFLLNHFDLGHKSLQIIKPIRDKGRLLLQVHALVNKWFRVLKESFHFLEAPIKLVDTKVLVFRST